MKIHLLLLLISILSLTWAQNTFTEEELKTEEKFIGCMAMTHYYFSLVGNDLHKHIKERNITASEVADSLTNFLLVNCLEKSKPEA
jgi:hypothetical protein